jgi:ribosomal protein S18 acetylase RimI-like enzyme
MLPVRARSVTSDDVEALVELYRALEDEMTPLSHLWPLADGLPEPVAEAFRAMVADPATVAVIGEIDEVALGFCVARVESMHPQAEGRRIGSIRLIFVAQPAREVGVGEAMLEAVLNELRSRGVGTFDAHVLPGHRLVKNFFEAGGFKARSIVMSRYEDV